MAKPKPGGRRPRKRERKNVTVGVVHIKSSFNNTIVSITDTEGNVISFLGFAQPHPFRRSLGCRYASPGRDGARFAPRRSAGQGPRLGP